MKNVNITAEFARKYPISDTLFGIFLEDINFACDGGLNANKINNYSFDGAYKNMNGIGEISDPLRYWIVESGTLTSGEENPLDKNSKYAVLEADGNAAIYNLGYNGAKANKDRAAVSVVKGRDYVFSLFVRNDGFDGSVKMTIVSEDGKDLTEPLEFKAKSKDWERKEFSVKATDTEYGKFKLELCGSGKLHLDVIIFRDGNVWGNGDPKWRHGLFRRDLIEALDAIKPKFMRFPGGCIVEGEYPGNEYNWKDTVGELWERKSKYNLWSESLPDGGYNQSNQIGFYEYFCLCEDLGMKPLPTLWAGLNCQYRARNRGESCPEIKVGTPEFQTEVIDMYLDLIEFANGDPEKNEWAALRAKMGHPEPFGLDRIGVGNENFDEIYFEKFDAISAVLREKYPEIKLILSAGGSPDYDRLEPIWKFAKEKHPYTILDEHSYHRPSWFVEMEKRFDNYERGTAKVYMGEYAANNPDGYERTSENGNCYDTAIAEAAFLCGIERNGDVVEMSSYAPLFNLVSSDQWRHNLIDYNPQNMCLTTNYHVQRMFSSTCGKFYVPTLGKVDENIYISCVEADEKTYLRVININAEEAELSVDLLKNITSLSLESLSSADTHVKNVLKFYGETQIKVAPEKTDVAFDGQSFSCVLKPNSVNNFEITF